MTAYGVMNGLPPVRDQLVTLANWRRAPFSQRAFRNVRRLVPSANISCSKKPLRRETDIQDVVGISFAGVDGRPTTIAAALPATNNALMVRRRGPIIAEWYGEGMNERSNAAQAWRRGFDVIAKSYR